MLSSKTLVARRGLTTFETLGCLLAVVGGVWLGANYVGLDLRGAAYQALDDSDMLTQIPEDWRPANPDCPDGDCPTPAEVRAEQRVRLESEFEALRFEVARLTGGSTEVGFDPSAAATLSGEDEAARDRTVAYWQELSEIVFQVTALEQRVASFSGTERQPQAFALRRRSLAYGESAVNALDIEGVESQASETGARVAEWFAQGAESLQTAVDLKSRQPVGGRSMTAAEVWAQTEADLQKRTELVRRKSHETSAYLTTRFFVEFPPLGI